MGYVNIIIWLGKCSKSFKEGLVYFRETYYGVKKVEGKKMIKVRFGLTVWTLKIKLHICILQRSWRQKWGWTCKEEFKVGCFSHQPDCCRSPTNDVCASNGRRVSTSTVFFIFDLPFYLYLSWSPRLWAILSVHGWYTVGSCSLQLCGGSI